jgi:phospholipase C
MTPTTSTAVGPHGEDDATTDVNKGKMNGFIKATVEAKGTCLSNLDPACNPAIQKAYGGLPDVMGYHRAAEIPNYWTYAQQFVLDDHDFEPVRSWSLPDHLYLVSGWSAQCKTKKASSCQNEIAGPEGVAEFDDAVSKELATGVTDINLAWTDLTWLLFKNHVSWGYYVQTGEQPDCDNASAEICKPVPQSFKTPGIWNPCRSSPMSRPTIRRRTSSPWTTSSTKQPREPCPTCRGSHRPTSTASTRPTACIRARLIRRRSSTPS